MKSILYLLIDSGGCCYVILIGTSCIPNFLHDFDWLLDRDIPSVSGLTDKENVCHNECMLKPVQFYPVWKLLIARFSGCRFTRLCRALNNKLLAKHLEYCIKGRKKCSPHWWFASFPWGGLLIATARSLPLISSLSDRPPFKCIDSEVLDTGFKLDLDLVAFEDWWVILMLLLRMEDADKWLAPLVSKGMLDLVQLEVKLNVGPWEVDFFLVFIGIAEAHSFIAAICFGFLYDASVKFQ